MSIWGYRVLGVVVVDSLGNGEMTKHPQSQDRVREEIAAVFGCKA